jgi:hypothetical protein
MKLALLVLLAAGVFPAQADPLAAYYRGLDRSCKTDMDCAIKNVGSCCGQMPACLSKAAKANPGWVRATCDKEGLTGVCGFKPVVGCQCRQGTCTELNRVPN